MEEKINSIALLNDLDKQPRNSEESNVLTECLLFRLRSNV